jgi:hypothetical protein
MGGGCEQSRIGKAVVIWVLVVTLLCVICAASAVAGASEAGRARRYSDKDQDAYWVLLRANPNRVLSGSFIVFDREALNCGDGGGSIVGGWDVKNVEITNGRFRAVKYGTLGDSIRYRLTFRGTRKGDTIRGAVSMWIVSQGGGGGYECWSGKGPDNPAVHYVATAG